MTTVVCSSAIGQNVVWNDDILYAVKYTVFVYIFHNIHNYLYVTCLYHDDTTTVYSQMFAFNKGAVHNVEKTKNL